MKLLLVFSLFMPFAACNAQPDKKENVVASSDKIEAYYFHFSARCITCKTVEAEAKKNIETLYPDWIKQGKISFRSVNLDEASSKAISEKLQISGQTLLLVKGNKKVNITNEGFMYARSNPEKFKAVIKEKVDGLKL